MVLRVDDDIESGLSGTADITGDEVVDWIEEHRAEIVDIYRDGA